MGQLNTSRATVGNFTRVNPIAWIRPLIPTKPSHHFQYHFNKDEISTFNPRKDNHHTKICNREGSSRCGKSVCGIFELSKYAYQISVMVTFTSDMVKFVIKTGN